MDEGIDDRQQNGEQVKPEEQLYGVAEGIATPYPDLHQVNQAWNNGNH